MKLESRRPGKGDGSNSYRAGGNWSLNTEQCQRQRMVGTLSLRAMREAAS